MPAEWMGERDGPAERIASDRRNGHATVRAVAQGAGIVAAAHGDAVRIWDSQTGRHLKSIGGRGIRSLAFAGDLLALGGADGAIRLWNHTSGDLFGTLTGHQHVVCGLAGDATTLTSASHDGTVRVWDVPNAEAIAILDGHDGGAHAVALTTSALITASHDGNVRVFSREGFRLLRTLPAGVHGVYSVAASASIIVGGNHEGGLFAWNATDGTVRFEQSATGCVSSNVALHTYEGQLLVVAKGCYAGSYGAWDAGTGEPVELPGGFENNLAVLPRDSAFKDPAIRHVGVGADPCTAVWNGVKATADEARVRLSSLETGELQRTLRGFDGAIVAVRFTEAGLVVAEESGEVSLWDEAGRHDLAKLPEGCYCLATAPNGTIAAGAGDGTISLIDQQTRAVLNILTGHTDWVCALDFTDGILVSSGGDGTIRHWNPLSGRELERIMP